MGDELMLCPFCGGEAVFHEYTGRFVEVALANRCDVPAMIKCERCGAMVSFNTGTRSTRRDAADAWNRRAERTWHDFSDELPPVGASVLCRGKNGALYVGKLVTFNGNGTRKVWVPRGDQYRTPEKWKAVDES